jgi:hypothetical protein
MKKKIKSPEKHTNPLSFLIWGVVSSMHRLPIVKQGGVPPQVHVRQEQRQRGISARKEEPRVLNAVQEGRLQGANVGREVRLGALSVGVVVQHANSVKLGPVLFNTCQFPAYCT